MVEKTKFPGVYEYKATKKVNGKQEVSYYVHINKTRKLVGKRSWGMTPEKAYQEKVRLTAELLGLGHLNNYTLEDIWNKYDLNINVFNKNPSNNRWLWSQVKNEFGFKELTAITPSSLQSFLASGIQSGLSPKTACDKIRFIGTLFRFALKNRWYQGSNPVQAVQKPKKPDNERQRFLTKEEVSEILGLIRGKSERDYLLSLISVTTGARFGEIAAIRYDDINWDEAYITLNDTKNGERRNILLPPDTLNYLRSYIVEHGYRDLIFPSNKGTKLTVVPNLIQKSIDKVANEKLLTRASERIAMAQTMREVQAIKQEVRVAKAVFHTFRHTYASWIVQSGGNLFDVQSLLGHKTVQMSARYAKLSMERKRTVITQAISGFQA